RWGNDDTYYSAVLAQFWADQARARPKAFKLEALPLLRHLVIDLLNEKISPQQISVRLRRLFPDDEDMQISHESIYQALYVQGAGTLRHELKVEGAIRSGRTSRKPVSKLPARSKRTWLAGHRLADRDEVTAAEHAGRKVPGHWEGDLVVGPNNSGIITLVERASRFTLLGRLPGTRDSTTVIDKLTTMIETLPDAVARSITWDQGTEMAQHARFTVATGCPVYFCDPHSPWQRPTNENLNGQLRWEYPKGTDFNHISDDELRSVQDMLNARPRVILHGATPSETLDELI
ncbi:IS30 family transposase, partial [Tersicoccus sp. MR15.9]|uniref:IS30 family transposase n=1 Tax=Tersicoccus mangrovi TaxID=3121635 RepID=UPI002FE59D75